MFSNIFVKIVLFQLSLIKDKCVIQVHFLGVNLQCVVLENFHTPPTERIGNS